MLNRLRRTKASGRSTRQSWILATVALSFAIPHWVLRHRVPGALQAHLAGLRDPLRPRKAPGMPRKAHSTEEKDKRQVAFLATGAQGRSYDARGEALSRSFSGPWLGPWRGRTWLGSDSGTRQAAFDGRDAAGFNGFGLERSCFCARNWLCLTLWQSFGEVETTSCVCLEQSAEVLELIPSTCSGVKPPAPGGRSLS